MGWGQGTIEALQAAVTLPLSLVLRVRRNAAGGGVGDDFIASSRLDHNADAALDPSSYRSQAATLTVQSWGLRPGLFSIDVILPTQLTQGRGALASKSLRRGALVELLAGNGADLSTYLPIRRGRIQGVTNSGRHRATVEVYSLLYSLKGRPTPALDGSSLPQTRLFHGICGEETTVSGVAYAPAASTLDLADASSFVTFNGTGVAKVTGDSGGVFYLTFTGKSSNQLTGVSSAGQFNTTAEDAAVGNTVQSVAHLSGHPVTIAQRLLVSTGAGTNGAEDVYPEAAGFALDEEWVDDGQFRMVRATVTKVLSGSYVWEVLVESPVEDGLLWLQGLLAPAGIWLCERQGEVAVRAAQSLTSAETVGQSLEITDADIIGHPTVLWYDPAVPYAYNRYALRTNDEDDSDDSVLACTTLPLRDELLVDVTGRVFANEEQVRLDMLRRCDDYAHYPGEVITLNLRGAWWGLCPGDVIDLTTQRARGRFVSTYAGYDARRCLVLSADPHAGGEGLPPTTAATLLAMPLTPGDDHAA